MTELRTIHRDGLNVAQARCPRCNVWADADDDQLTGLVSLVCSECEWHGYVDPPLVMPMAHRVLVERYGSLSIDEAQERIR